MANGADGDARAEVEIFNAVFVPDLCAGSPFDYDGKTSVGGDDEFLIQLGNR